jgi:magnesium chelatase family protein
VLAKVYSCGLKGIDGVIVEVEIDIREGFPGFNIVGLPDTAVKESKERVITALINSEFELPQKRITINLAPADIKKIGALYDLPIAIGILNATYQITSDKIANYMIVGELSLDGKINPIHGALIMATVAQQNNFDGIILPKENAAEAAIVKK